jgi:hypothetical protein
MYTYTLIVGDTLVAEMQFETVLDKGCFIQDVYADPSLWTKDAKNGKLVVHDQKELDKFKINK